MPTDAHRCSIALHRSRGSPVPKPASLSGRCLYCIDAASSIGQHRHRLRCLNCIALLWLSIDVSIASFSFEALIAPLPSSQLRCLLCIACRDEMSFQRFNPPARPLAMWCNTNRNITHTHTHCTHAHNNSLSKLLIHHALWEKGEK